MQIVPHVETRKHGADWLASASFRLRDIEAGASSNAVRLLESIARWESRFSLEMHISVAGPKTSVRLRLHVVARSRLKALEHCLANCLSLHALLEAVWPHAEFEVLSGPEVNPPLVPASCLAIRRRIRRIELAHPLLPVRNKIGFEYAASRGASKAETVEHLSPWIPTPDDWLPLLHTMAAYPAPLWIVIRLGNRAAAEQLDSTVASYSRFLAACAPEAATAEQVLAIRSIALERVTQLAACSLRGEAMLLSPGPADSPIAAMLGHSITSTALYHGGFETVSIDPLRAMQPFHFATRPLTADEAACAFRLPQIGTFEDAGLPVRRHRTCPVPFPAAAGAIAVNRHRGLDQPVAIPDAHRLKPVLVVGMTGTGKSTLLLSMLLGDVRQDGLCLIDPHGETADELLARIPAERMKDVILMDLGDTDHPVPFNLLAANSIEERDRHIDEMLAGMIRVYRDLSMFGPIFEQNFRGMAKLLSYPCRSINGPLTLLEFPLLFSNANFRKHLLRESKDEQVRDFVEELERVSSGECRLENLAPYVTNKLGRFLQDTFLRRMVGHGAMALDFRAIMDEGKILILKLARGRLGESVANLIASTVVSRIRDAAMGRISNSGIRPRRFFLYVDEFGSVADDNFPVLAAEARKAGLGLVMSTQCLSQLRDRSAPRDILSAVMGNIGTLAAFRVGPEDAPLLEPFLFPHLTAQDMLACPNFHGYMKFHLDREVTAPFSFETIPAAPVTRSAARVNPIGASTRECDQRISNRRLWVKSL